MHTDGALKTARLLVLAGLVLLAGALAPSRCAYAQSPAQPPATGDKSTTPPGPPELLTDRPDFTETSFVVPLHSLQLESGFTYTDGAGSSGHEFNIPELLLRYGFGRRTELRVGVPDYIHTRRGRSRSHDFGDLYLGFKQQFGPPDAGYGFALIPAVTVPTGGGRVSSGAVDPEMVVTWSKDLSSRWSVGGILGFGWPTEDGDRRFSFFPTISLARSLSERWGTFFEWAGDFPQRGRSSQVLHHGYTYALSAVSQLDVHFGAGITREAPDFFIGAGYAVRF